MPPPPSGTPTPTYTCNGDNPERYGWIRLTRAHTARTYHLMFCTENGWIEIQSGGSGAGRRLEGAGDLVADLREVATLYDAGLITAAEYALAKVR